MAAIHFGLTAVSAGRRAHSATGGAATTIRPMPRTSLTMLTLDVESLLDASRLLATQ